MPTHDARLVAEDQARQVGTDLGLLANALAPHGCCASHPEACRDQRRFFWPDAAPVKPTTTRLSPTLTKFRTRCDEFRQSNSRLFHRKTVEAFSLTEKQCLHHRGTMPDAGIGVTRSRYLSTWR